MMTAMHGDPSDDDDACKPERTAGKTERLVPKTRQMFSNWKRVSIDEKLKTTSYARQYQHYCLMLNPIWPGGGAVTFLRNSVQTRVRAR